jgi:hypothetical protein
MDEKSTALVAQIEREYSRVTPIIISNELQAKEMDDILSQIKMHYKEVEDKRKELKAPIIASGKALDAFFDKPKQTLENAQRIISNAILDYRRRIAEEARKQQEELNRKAEEERQRLEERASKAEEKGKDDKAESLRMKADAVVAPVINAEVKLENSCIVKTWKYEIIDVDKLPREYMIPDDSKIGKMVRASGGTLKIEGVRIYAEESLRAK